MSLLRDKYIEKQASIAALQKKQYWQLLKRMYGGTENAVAKIKETGDTGIWHGSRDNAADKIMQEGLLENESIGDKGVFFGPRSLAGVLSKDLVRLKKPSELGHNQLYPDVTDAMAVGKNHAEMWAPASWKSEDIPRRYNDIDDVEARKFKYFGINEQGKKEFPSHEVMYKGDIPSNLLHRIDNEDYFNKSQAIFNKPLEMPKDNEAVGPYFAKRIKTEQEEMKKLNESYRGKKDVKLASLHDRHMEKTARLKETVQLYPHQEHAVQKIVDNDETDRNTILAHSVGAGKTLTTIAGFEKLREKGRANRALVVVPASLRENYALKGVEEFTDSSYNMVGNKQENRSPKLHYHEVDPGKDYNIVSYEMFRKDPRHYIEGSDADTVIFDELHRSKNITKTYDSIRDSRNLYKTFIGGTGSIVSNKLTDVVPLIDAATAGENAMTKRENIRRIEQKFFIRDNSKRFKDVKEERRPIIALKNKGLLKRELGKYIDFVDFDDIAESANMPHKEVHEIEVPITQEQATAYKKLLHNDKSLDKLIRQRRYEYMRDDELSRMYNKLMEARKIMNDVGTYQPKMRIHDTVEATPKTRRLLENVEQHLDEDPNNKALLTSFLVRGGTESLEAGLQNRGIPYGKFIGKGNDGVTEESRQKAVEDFNAGKVRALILSGAGGEGLSLGDTTEIDMLDSHFNPEKIKQMEARGIRSGGLAYKDPEDRKVVSNRYIATMPEHKFLFLHWKDKLKTPDEIIYEIADKKEKQNKLLHDVLKEDRDKRKVASLHDRYIEKQANKAKEMFKLLSEESQARLFAPQVAKDVKLTSGELKEEPWRKMNYAVFNHARELAGINTGSKEILRKIAPNKVIIDKSVIPNSDLDKIIQHSGQSITREDVMGNIGEAAYKKGGTNISYNRGDGSPDYQTGMIVMPRLTEKSFRTSSDTIDKDWDRYHRGERSLNQRYTDAISLRHEVDEVRYGLKSSKDNTFIRNNDTGKYTNAKGLNPNATRFVDGVKANHSNVGVLHQESALTSFAPKEVREKWQSMRDVSYESSTLMPSYGESAVVNKKSLNQDAQRVRNTVDQKIKRQSVEGKDVTVLRGETLSKAEDITHKFATLRERYIEKQAKKM